MGTDRKIDLEKLKEQLDIFKCNPFVIRESKWMHAFRYINRLFDTVPDSQEPLLNCAHLFLERGDVDGARLTILALAYCQVEQLWSERSAIDERLSFEPSSTANTPKEAEDIILSKEGELLLSILAKVKAEEKRKEFEHKAKKGRKVEERDPSAKKVADAFEKYWRDSVLPDRKIGGRTARLSVLCKSAGIEVERFRAIAIAMSSTYIKLGAIAGNSEAIKRVKKEVWEACFGGDHLKALIYGTAIVRDTHVLIQGETGVGKEFVAQAIQAGTLGANFKLHPPRIEMNAAAIPESLRMSELFGHLANIATDIKWARKGKIFAAHEGTLFLDEIAELDVATQALLLRVIQEKSAQPLGEDEKMEFADVRYIGATNVELEQHVRYDRFRLDLYLRLAGRIIRVPPLRERMEDIEDIGNSMVKNIQTKMGMTNYLFPYDEIQTWLRSSEVQDHNWPGNIRELYTVLRNKAFGVDTSQRPYSLPDGRANYFPTGILECEWEYGAVLDWYFERAWRVYAGNQSLMERELGRNRNWVRETAKRLGLK